MVDQMRDLNSYGIKRKKRSPKGDCLTGQTGLLLVIVKANSVGKDLVPYVSKQNRFEHPSIGAARSGVNTSFERDIGSTLSLLLYFLFSVDSRVHLSRTSSGVSASIQKLFKEFRVQRKIFFNPKFNSEFETFFFYLPQVLNREPYFFDTVFVKQLVLTSNILISYVHVC